MFSAKELNLEESELRQQIARLSHTQQALYKELEKNALKSASTYASLNTLLLFGIHHFYLQRWFRGALNLLLSLTGLYLLALGGERIQGVVLLLTVCIIEVPQLLNGEHLVHAYNIRIMRRCLQRAEKCLP